MSTVETHMTGIVLTAACIAQTPALKTQQLSGSLVNLIIPKDRENISSPIVTGLVLKISDPIKLISMFDLQTPVKRFFP